jgi:2-methylaconitate cis-trans-isomerase PrpF
VVNRIALTDGEGRIRFGHPSGSLTVGAQAEAYGGEWTIRKVSMSRSARRIMEGWVRVPVGQAT